MQLKSYAQGKWLAGSGRAPRCAMQPLAPSSHALAPTASILPQCSITPGRWAVPPCGHSRSTSAPRLLKRSRNLTDRKDEFYALSYATGATKSDSWIDIDGGIGTLFVVCEQGHA